MKAAAELARIRSGAGLFRLRDRGLVEVSGRDRVRWLDGMLSNDIGSLAAGSERSGCYALLLTRKARIVADLHVLARDEHLWLETAAAALPRVLDTLGSLIVADQVELRDASRDWERLALEGAAAPRLLEAALGRPLPLAPDACGEAELAGVPLWVAAFGFAGLPARQLFAPAGRGELLAAALCSSAASLGLVEASVAVLELLRIEAGTPRLGAELDEEVLPAEARLEHAISRSKGCYTGQEIVERQASRGRVNHLLVGFSLEGAEPAPVGATVTAGGDRIGEVTSACVSPAAGAIALGYVRAVCAEAGTKVEIGGRPARVTPLPFAAAVAKDA